jgi:hypothetical protein
MVDRKAADITGWGICIGRHISLHCEHQPTTDVKLIEFLYILHERQADPERDDQVRWSRLPLQILVLRLRCLLAAPMITGAACTAAI